MGQHERTVVTAGADEVRVLVADDQEIFRGALREVIDAIPGFVLVGEATSAEEAMEAVDSLSPALVLMDVRMPGMGGIRGTREIVNRHPRVVVILMSLDPAEGRPGVTHACGAAAFLRKQDLRPGMLRDIWEMQQAGKKSGEAGSEPGHLSRRDEPAR